MTARFVSSNATGPGRKKTVIGIRNILRPASGYLSVLPIYAGQIAMTLTSTT